jgi:hypothetical protein
MESQRAVSEIRSPDHRIAGCPLTLEDAKTPLSTLWLPFDSAMQTSVQFLPSGSPKYLLYPISRDHREELRSHSETGGVDMRARSNCA